MATSQQFVPEGRPALQSAPCTTCAHSDFIHSDYDERACLFSGCECPVYSTERGSVLPPRSGAVAAIVATKEGNTITMHLSAPDSIERAATLARLGWKVRVVRGH